MMQLLLPLLLLSTAMADPLWMWVDDQSDDIATELIESRDARNQEKSNNWDCWAACHGRSGMCKACGSGGACCRRGWKATGCDAATANPNHHACQYLGASGCIDKAGCNELFARFPNNCGIQKCICKSNGIKNQCKKSCNACGVVRDEPWKNDAVADQIVDWAALEELEAKLPTGSTNEERARRTKMFADFDNNGNKLLSRAEVNKGVSDLGIDAMPAVMLAFDSAKDKFPSPRGGMGDGYVESNEFSTFMRSLKQYFEYFIAFSVLDANKDDRLSLIELTSKKDLIKNWIGNIDLEAEFKKMDKNDGGYVLFKEFAQWAVENRITFRGN